MTNHTQNNPSTWLSHRVTGIITSTPARYDWGSGLGFQGLLGQYGGASAAYSLRRLGPYNGPVVSLRRASDNEERHFTAGELTGSVVGTQVILNPEFDAATGWAPTGGWSISGGQAVNSGTDGNLQQGGRLTVGVNYIATIEISACSNFADARIRFGASSTYLLSDLGITSTGTYQIAFEATSTFFLLQTINSATMTVDFMGCEEYTPTGAEAWVIDGVSNTTQLFAYATIWHDQSATDDQVFPDTGVSQTGSYVASGDASTATAGALTVTASGSPSSVTTTGFADFMTAGKTYRITINYHTDDELSPFWVSAGSGGTAGGTDAFPSLTPTSASFLYTAQAGDLDRITIGTNSVYNGTTITITGINCREAGNPAIQDTITAQPLLIRAGITNTVGGKAALDFDGTDDDLSVGSTALSTARQDSFLVMQTTDTDHVMLSQSPTSAGYGWTASDGSASTLITSDFGTPTLYANGTQPAQATRGDIHTALSTGSQVLASTIGADTSVWSDTLIAGFASGAFRFSGDVQEWIFYPSDQSANRNNIEANIADAFEMPHPSQDLISAYMPEMAAGYSLRDLGGGGNVVRLRRASDNAEQDFTAADVEAGTAGSELVTNGDFATDTVWTKGANWTITGGQAVSDGSVNYGYLGQNGVISDQAGVYYIITFDIVACSDFGGAGTLIDNAAIQAFAGQWQITSTGTYSAIFKTTGTSDGFAFWTQSGVTLTIDNVSCKPYTPSAAELWAANDRVKIHRQSNESAFATTWYDQSNEDGQNRDLFGSSGSLNPADWTLNGPNAVIENGVLTVYRGTERLDPASPDGIATFNKQIIKAGRKYAVKGTSTYLAGPLGGYRLAVGDDQPSIWNSIAAYNPFEPTVDGTVFIAPINATAAAFQITDFEIVDITTDATQTTSTAQPLLIRAGVTHTVGGKAALDFDGTDDELTASYSPSDYPITQALVAQGDTGNSGYALSLHLSGQADEYLTGSPVDASAIAIYSARTTGANAIPSNAITAGDHVLMFSYSSSATSHSTHKNGGTAATSSTSVTFPAPDTIAVGNLRDNSPLYFSGGIQEAIIYASDQSANRTIIETNINNEYGIY